MSVLISGDNMPRDTNTIFKESDIFAKDSLDKEAPPFPMTEGWSPDYDAGGGKFLSRKTFNNLFYRLYFLAENLTKYGGSLEWASTIAYEKGAMVVYSGVPYYAKTATTGNQPDTSTSQWGRISVPDDFNPVSSVFGRTGDVVATLNDYDAGKIQYTAPINTWADQVTQSQAALDRLIKAVGSTGQVILTGSSTPGGLTLNLEANQKKRFSFGEGSLVYSPYPNTNWPRNVGASADHFIWNKAVTTLLDNGLVGQPHTWVITLKYTLEQDVSERELTISMESVKTDFKQKKIVNLGFDQGESLSDVFTVEFHTTASNESIYNPDDNTGGYQLFVSSARAIKIELASINRKSALCDISATKI